MAVHLTPGLNAFWWHVVLLCGATGAVEYMDCNSRYTLQSVEISGCSTAPCQIALNTTVNVTTHFTPVRDATSLTNNVYFSLNNARIVASVRPDPCSSFVCPLSTSAHKAYTYSSEVLVPGHLPALGGELAWSLQDEQSVTVICFRVDIQLLPRTTSAGTSSQQQEPAVPDGAHVSGPGTLPSHPADTSSGQHDSSSSGQQDSSSGGQHDPSYDGQQNPSSGGQHHPSYGGQHNPSYGGQYDPYSGGQQNPSSGGQHDPSYGGQHNPSYGGQHNPSYGGQYGPSSGGQQNPSSGGQHNPPGGAAPSSWRSAHYL